MTARISIIIPYYNQQRHIREAVCSAIKQRCSAHVEVIVVDDGSFEPATPCLEGLPDVTLIRTPNQGCAAARNRGFAQSSGDYIIFLDQDDVLHPDAATAHLQAFTTNPNAGLSFGAYRSIDNHGKVLSPPIICKHRNDFRPMVFEKCPMISPGTAMIRREAFLEIDGFRGAFSAQVDDYDFYLRLIQHFPFVRHTSCVLDYRLHDTNVSRDSAKMLAGTLEVLDHFQASNVLSITDLRRLRHGKKRWIHHYCPQPTFTFHLKGLYYNLRTMLSLPPSSWF